jgi:hypothetical protein
VTDALVSAAFLAAAAIVLFTVSVVVGLSLGRRLDRAVQIRAEADEPKPGSEAARIESAADASPTERAEPVRLAGALEPADGTKVEMQ